jgi:hypothetical protein
MRSCKVASNWQVYATIPCFYFTYLLTELSPSWEAANCAATPELPSILRHPKVHHRVHKCRPLFPNLSQIDPVHTIPSYLSKMELAITINKCKRNVMNNRLDLCFVNGKVGPSEFSVTISILVTDENIHTSYEGPIPYGFHFLLPTGRWTEYGSVSTPRVAAGRGAWHCFQFVTSFVSHTFQKLVMLHQGHVQRKVYRFSLSLRCSELHE